MDDEASCSLDSKVLGNMRVVDLKHELEKRGMSKSGSKKDLVKRLKQQVEFEKLCEERKSGDIAPKLELDAETQQNEFVQQYLAQQQKRYAERQEEKRLQMEAMQKHSEDDSTASTENENEVDVDHNTEDSMIHDEEAQNIEKETKENDSEDTISIAKSSVKEEEEEKNSTAKEEEKGERNSNSSDVAKQVEDLSQATKNVKAEEECTLDSNAGEIICDTNTTQIVEKGERNTNSSDVENQVEDLSQATKNFKAEKECTLDSNAGEIICDTNTTQIVQNYSVTDNTPLENKSKSDENRQIDTDPTDSKNMQKNEKDCCLNKDIHEPVQLSVHNDHNHPSETSEVIHELSTKGTELKRKDNVISSNDINSSKNTENTPFVQSPKNIPSVHEEVEETVCHSSLNKIPCTEDLQKQSPKNMETSECSAVPFSLSDIQLPKSPPEPPEDLKSEKVEGKIKRESENGASNGEAACDSKSSREGAMSDSETKENCSNESSGENKENKNSKDSRHSVESSDVESDRNSSPVKKSLSNVADNSDENKSTNLKNKHSKSVKGKEPSEESDNDKSSDSDKYNHHHSDSKHKTHTKRRKRNRRSRSSSSSSSQSSDSSPERRHSKKSPTVSKNRNSTENDESNQVSDKSPDERLKKPDNGLEASVSNISHKKRFKIKRDNVPVEVSSVANESVEKITSEDKSEKSSKESSNSTSNKVVPSQQSTESKEISKTTYTPRKINLSNRKLNRRTSEEVSNGSKTKKSKWENFAASQKASHTTSISTDSLKNWFPDFKLISEASSSMEIDQDESSLPTINEKGSDQTSDDVSYGNDTVTRKESTSRNEVDEFESQEPNFEDTSEKGPVSKIIFIQNLVRPFTLNQLKELLKQSGNLVEEYFWIDKIKSKCFVMYETEKEAIRAKNALHNARWPSSNPKILSVEFSNEEELELHKSGNEQPPPKPPELQEPEPPEVLEPRISHPVEDHKRKDRERRKERDRSKGQGYVREWDKDKIMQESPERDHIPKEEKSRSSEKKEKKESKKRPNEDTPAKLLDDLFQKTKSLPCIYWLPLTEEQAKQKEEEKKIRKLEREKRLQQKEQEDTDRTRKRDRSSRRSREKENRRSSTRSRSPVTRRR